MHLNPSPNYCHFSYSAHLEFNNIRKRLVPFHSFASKFVLNLVPGSFKTSYICLLELTVYLMCSAQLCFRLPASHQHH